MTEDFYYSINDPEPGPATDGVRAGWENYPREWRVRG